MICYIVLHLFVSGGFNVKEEEKKIQNNSNSASKQINSQSWRNLKGNQLEDWIGLDQDLPV